MSTPPPKYPTLEQVQIPPEQTAAWQKTLVILARMLSVPASLIMRVHEQQIEVFQKSPNPENVYQVGEKADLDTGLYCEQVMSSRQVLAVPNALMDPEWDHNPDVELGMISYLGLPLLWPEGEVFGTICVLDKVERHFSEEALILLGQFRLIIQNQLANLYHLARLEEEVAARKRLEQELRQQNQALLQETQRADQAMADQNHLLHVLSHDLRTHLGNIRSIYSLREVNEKGFEELSDQVPLVADQALELIEMVRTLHSLELRQPKLGPVDLVQAVQTSQQQTGYLLRQKEMRWVLDLTPDLWVQAEPVSLVNTVLNNLITNAVKFSPRGSAIEIKARPTPEGVVLSVSDQGVGIPEDVLPDLFDFKTNISRPGTEKERGTGFGLPLVQKFMRAYGGRVRIETATEGELGQGTGTCVELFFKRA